MAPVKARERLQHLRLRVAARPPRCPKDPACRRTFAGPAPSCPPFHRRSGERRKWDSSAIGPTRLWMQIRAERTRAPWDQITTAARNCQTARAKAEEPPRKAAAAGIGRPPG